MKKLITLIIFFFLYFYSFGQKIIWAKRIGGTSTDNVVGMQVGITDDVYTAGNFDGTSDFDPGIDSFKLYNSSMLSLYQDIFISKLNSEGNFVWAKSLRGLYTEHCTSITLDNHDNIYISGFFNDVVDFDPSIGTYNLTALGTGTDIFILKLDSAGNFLWAKRIGGKVSESVSDLTTDDFGNVYAIGTFSDTVDFDPSLGTYNLSTINTNTFILVLDSLGNFKWVKKLDSYTDGTSIELNKAGNIFCSGTFQSTADFDPSTTGTFNLTSNGDRDIFLLKLNNAGNFIWVRGIGGTGADIPVSVYVDDSDWVYSTGQFIGNVDFNPGSGTYNLASTKNSNDAYILKLDSTGSFLWARKFGGDDSDFGSSIAVDTIGNVYTTGYFKLTVDFDPGSGIKNLNTNYNGDIYISSLDASGNYLSAINIGGYDFEYPSSIHCNRKGYLYTTGIFNNSVNFNPGGVSKILTSAGKNDIFIAKYCPPFVVSGTISGPTALCSGSTATYSISSVKGAINYIWGAPLGATILSGQGTTSVTIMFGQDSGFVYVLPLNFCGSGNSLSLKVILEPIILAGAIPPTICLGGSTSLSAYGANTYTWSPSTGLKDTIGNHIIANPIVTTTYTVTGTKGTCSYSKTFTVTVTPPQPITVNPAAPSICAGESVTIVANGANTYTWYPTVGLDTTKGSTVIAKPNVTTTYTITGAFNGCIETKTVTVSVNQPPIMYTNPAAATICAKGSVSITASGATTYSWFPATGLNTTSGPTIIAKPLVTTTYIVTGTLNGCVDTNTVTVVVKPAPLSATTLNGITINANLSGAIYQWLKCPNYSIIVGATNQSYTPVISGIYAVLVTYNGCSDTSSCVTVNMSGISENKNKFEFSIYPNPNNGSFIIESKQNGSYSIINELGQLIKTFELNSVNKNRIQIDGLNCGLYIIIGVDKNKTANQKIIVLR